MNMEERHSMEKEHSMEEGNSMEEERDTTSRQAEEAFLAQTLAVIHANLGNYGEQIRKMRADIDEMLEHYHDDDPELNLLLNNTITLHDHMKRSLERNEKAQNKPYFGRIVFWDEALGREESLYIGKGGISSDPTHQTVVDWRAPVANTYYENGLGKCSYTAPGDKVIEIDLKLKRTYEIENGKLLDYFDSEVIANDELLTKYLAKNKQAVLGEIVATIQKEQNEIIRKSPYHNIIVQGVAGSGKTTVAMHRISFILYNYADRFKPDDFYIVGSNRILLNYITGVLPDLDVHGIRQMTMEQLFVRLLYEDWDEKKYRIRKSAQSGNRDSIKGGYGWFQDLKAYCDELEWESILRESIYLNPRQFVEGCKDGKTGVYDETGGRAANPGDLVLLVDGEAVERYIRQNPKVSMQNKINMLNDRLMGKVREEFLGKGIKYTEPERKAILKAYRGRYGGKVWKGSIFKLYQDFLARQSAAGKTVEIPDTAFDVYDLAALAYLYKRIKETEVISEAHHIVIDEAQDFGMMAYAVLHFCIQACTYTVMGDVSQNIHFGFGLNDWEELKKLFLPDPMDSFGVLKKSYRNTVEISDFATNILHHGQFSSYPVEPIIRHGDPVEVRQCADKKSLIKNAAQVCRQWQEKGFDTIAVVCRDQESADRIAQELGQYVEVLESDLEKAEFGNGILVLPVEYTKGLEFDTVLILNPDREEYPVDDGHAKLLYVAATRALHELCVLHTGNLTGLIADPLPERAAEEQPAGKQSEKQTEERTKEQAKNRTEQTEQTEQSDGASAKETSAMEESVSVCGLKTASRKKASSPEKPSTRPQNSKVSIVLNSSAGRADSPQESRTAPPFGQQKRMSQEMRTSQKIPGTGGQNPKAAVPAFGDIPATEKLRPAGHSRSDLSIRWVTKQPDGLSLQSRYGILRLSPVGSAIVRISFSRNGQPDSAAPGGIAVDRTEKYWMYKDSGNAVTMTTDELLIQVDKASGAIRYMTRDKKLLLAEHSKECRLLESGPEGILRTWLFLDWAKDERLYSFGPAGGAMQSSALRNAIPGAMPGTKSLSPQRAAQDTVSSLSLRGTARYISHGTEPDGAEEKPSFLLSDKGYGIVLPGTAVFSCDIPAYGSYLYAETRMQMDFYLIAGKRQDTILNAYTYLCGRL